MTCMCQQLFCVLCDILDSWKEKEPAESADLGVCQPSGQSAKVKLRGCAHATYPAHVLPCLMPHASCWLSYSPAINSCYGCADTPGCGLILVQQGWLQDKRTDEGTGPQYHCQIEPVSDAEEGAHVRMAAPDVLARARLVQRPGNIGLLQTYITESQPL